MLIKTQLHQPSNKSCVAKMSKNDFSIVVGGNSSCKFSFKIHTQFSFPRSERAALLLLQVFCLWLTNWVIRAMPAVLWCDCECVEKSQWLKFSLSHSRRLQLIFRITTLPVNYLKDKFATSVCCSSESTSFFGWRRRSFLSRSQLLQPIDRSARVMMMIIWPIRETFSCLVIYSEGILCVKHSPSVVYAARAAVRQTRRRFDNKNQRQRREKMYAFFVVQGDWVTFLCKIAHASTESICQNWQIFIIEDICLGLSRGRSYSQTRGSSSAKISLKSCEAAKGNYSLARRIEWMKIFKEVQETAEISRIFSSKQLKPISFESQCFSISSPMRKHSWKIIESISSRAARFLELFNFTWTSHIYSISIIVQRLRSNEIVFHIFSPFCY